MPALSPVNPFTQYHAKAWPLHAFPSPESRSEAFVLTITDDNCHVMKLRICRIYGLTLAVFLVPQISPFLTLYRFKPAPPFHCYTKETQTICGRPAISFTPLLCCFSPFTSPPLLSSLLTSLILFSTSNSTQLFCSPFSLGDGFGRPGFSGCSLFIRPISCEMLLLFNGV